MHDGWLVFCRSTAVIRKAHLKIQILTKAYDDEFSGGVATSKRLMRSSCTSGATARVIASETALAFDPSPIMSEIVP